MGSKTEKRWFMCLKLKGQCICRGLVRLLSLFLIFILCSCEPVGSLPKGSAPSPINDQVNLEAVAQDKSSIKSYFLAYYQKSYLLSWRHLRVQINQLEKLLNTKKAEVSSEQTQKEIREQWRKVIMAHAVWWGFPLRPIDSAKITQDIFSYPWMNPCGIEHNVAYWAKKKELGPGEILFTQQGFLALDYVLFQNLSREQSQCRRSHPLLEEWWQKSDNERYQDQWLWAKKLLAMLEDRLQSFESQWLEQQVWLKSLLARSEGELIKLLAHAAYESEEYKELFFHKILGLSSVCSKEAHLCYQKNLFFASDSIGFWEEALWYSWDAQVQMWSEYLKARGLSRLAEELTKGYESFFLLLQKLPKEEWAQVQAQFEGGAQCRGEVPTHLKPWCQVYQELNRFVGLLKRDLLLALSVSQPPHAQGDND